MTQQNLSFPLLSRFVKLGALAGMIGGGLIAFAAPAAAQVSVSVGTSSYDRDYSRGGYGNTRTIYCESDDMRYESCALGGPVERVYLQDRKSNSSCYQGRDWGYDRNRIWVRNGCRAVFAVVYSGGYSDRDYRDRDYRDYDRRDRRYDDRRYDDRRYDDRRYSNNGRDAAIRTCRAEIERDLRRAGYRDIDYDGVRYANAIRGGSGWEIGLEYDFEGSRRGRDFDRTINCRYDRGRAYVTNIPNTRYGSRW